MNVKYVCGKKIQEVAVDIKPYCLVYTKPAAWGNYDLWWKKTFSGRRPSVEDNL